MKVLIILISLTFAGCGRHIVDADFTKYVDSFNDAATKRGYLVDGKTGYRGTNGLNIEFATEKLYPKYTGNENAIAVCQGGSSILVDKDYWDSTSDTKKEMLIYHELGHCVLKRDHRDDFDGYQYVSLMNIGLVDETNYRNHRETYLDELFKESPLFKR